MLKKSVLLFIQMLVIFGVLLTSCDSENSTEPLAVEDKTSLSKIGGDPFDPPPLPIIVSLYNGSFEIPTLPNHSLANSLTGWTATSNDCVVVNDHVTPPTSQAVLFRGSTAGGDGVADALTSNWIRINPGKTYRLSGWMYRVGSEDDVYLDFNDGIGIGGNFTDNHTTPTPVHVWTKRSVEVYVPWNVTWIKVRCVGGEGNMHNSLYDGLTLEQVN